VSIQDLLIAYFTLQNEMDHDWVKFVCHLASSPLNHGLVEDTAYWRRAKQLIAQHVGEMPSEDWGAG
jgi:hypothetical protein